MKFHGVAKSLAVSMAALLVTACGGGGGDGAAAPGGVQLSGTAATGAALADATVEVKCAGGTGSTTTSTSGAYTITVSGGSLPCIVRASGTTGGGVAITLHSVVESGSVANVTPVTEMIVARLVGRMPEEAFGNFDPQQVTAADVAAAKTAIVDALKTAGVDLGSIDPLKDALVPATSSASGNAYDQLLDLLGGQIGPESLPLVVNQIALSAASNSTTGLTTAMTAVSGGALEGCPVALSGKYRTIDYTGGTQVHTVDFKAMTWLSEGNSASETIVRSSSQACEFEVSGTRFVIGPQGAGAFQAGDTTGYVFPVQSHTLASVVGTWNFLESGLDESSVGVHFFGKFTVNADGTTGICEYDTMSGVANFTTCTPDTSESSSVAESDGSFVLQDGSFNTLIYGYRGPSGVLSLFGTNNPSGASSAPAYRTHFLLVKPQALALPAVGTATKYWDVEIRYLSGVLTGQPLGADSTTVVSVDAAASTFTRERLSDSRLDTFKVNYPVEGLRYREASTGISSVYQMQVPNLGLTASFDNMPGHFYTISVLRP